MEEKIIKNPIKVIRTKCLECCCGSPMEVRLCPAKDCPLHPFRLGNNPYRKSRVLTEEQKKRLLETLADTRAKSNKEANS
jgi:hypothetical protein